MHSSLLEIYLQLHLVNFCLATTSLMYYYISIVVLQVIFGVFCGISHLQSWEGI
jgi:hypothetical protein